MRDSFLSCEQYFGNLESMGQSKTSIRRDRFLLNPFFGQSENFHNGLGLPIGISFIHPKKSHYFLG